MHESCVPHSRDRTKCTLVYIQIYPRKIVHIKHAQHFDLRPKTIAGSWLFVKPKFCSGFEFGFLGLSQGVIEVHY